MPVPTKPALLVLTPYILQAACDSQRAMLKLLLAVLRVIHASTDC